MLVEEAINKNGEEIFAEVIKENESAAKFFLANHFEVIKDDSENNQFIFKLNK